MKESSKMKAVFIGLLIGFLFTTTIAFSQQLGGITGGYNVTINFQYPR